MSHRHILHRKSKKLALAFEYVHDRLEDLPSYTDFLAKFGKWIGGAFAVILLIVTAPLWQKEIKNLLPKPLPLVIGLDAAQKIEELAQATLQKNWEMEIAAVRVHGNTLVTSIPEFVRLHPEILQQKIAAALSSIRSWQSRAVAILENGIGQNLQTLWWLQETAASPFRHIRLGAANDARAFSEKVAAQKISFPSLLTAEIALLKQITNFNQTDIRIFLDKAPNRSIALEEFLLRGKTLETSGLRSLNGLSAKKQAAESKNTRIQAIANTQEQAFLENLNALLPQKTAESFDDFIGTKYQTVVPRANSGLFGALETRFTQQLTVLRRNLDAVEKNKIALIANVQIFSTPGVDLGLIQ